MFNQVRIAETLQNPVSKAPWGGTFIGNVTVKTRCDVYPPFQLPFVPPQVVLYTSVTYPWSYTMPSMYKAGINASLCANCGGGQAGTSTTTNGVTVYNDMQVPMQDSPKPGGKE